MKLKWVTMRISDLDRSLFFYNGLLNLDVAAKFGNEEHQIVMLGSESESKIELIFEPKMKIENPGNGVSIGLEVVDLDRLIDVLKEHGFKATGPISPNPQMRFFLVYDPDGYTVQLVEQKASSICT